MKPIFVLIAALLFLAGCEKPIHEARFASPAAGSVQSAIGFAAGR
jgi:uncharacterized lipoprotein YajG